MALISLCQRPITLLEEVNDNNSAMEPVRFPVAAAAEVEPPAPAASSADAQICLPETEAVDMPQCSEHSIEQMDPKAPGWTQRYSELWHFNSMRSHYCIFDSRN